MLIIEVVLFASSYFYNSFVRVHICLSKSPPATHTHILFFGFVILRFIVRVNDFLSPFSSLRLSCRDVVLVVG